ncbi:metallophosphoesterase [Granulicella sibirica]|uniref:Tartrate-resistant acid phosphatase type 5 n=1 Tax=Granulicella sibirica TaxID=2479048 RepID=A0A4Q0SVG6_9BACT|nr:metallophosphoesterase [Granulicella sibirica]RXH54372.1 Tartrate-resistant acid phosphatase type 5 precursor [Granulicella sibirica]
MNKFTRRHFLQQSFSFSALALLASKGVLQAEAFAQVAPAPDSHHLFAVGDWGDENSQTQQKAVAAAMLGYKAKNNLTVENLLMLGDNWYGWLFGGEKSERWKSQFEDMYPASAFPGKCYAVLGNHDYEKRPSSKAEAQLAYAAEAHSRWTMPNRWYTFQFPESQPLIRVLALDSNFPETRERGFLHNPTLIQSQVDEQLTWLKNELAKPSQAPFTVVMAHHPIFSNGDHGDTPALIRDWNKLLLDNRVHLYLCGHDHDLQHLEFEGSPMSYVISGGGGAALHPLKISPARRGPYGMQVAGFTHLEVSASQMTIRQIDSSGAVLHSFVKYPDGRVALG